MAKKKQDKSELPLSQQLSDEGKSRLLMFVAKRFEQLESLRKPLDSLVDEEVQAYEGKDPRIDNRQEWEEKYKIPYIYSIVQTMTARIIESLFGHDNYLKFYIEGWENSDKLSSKIKTVLQRDLDAINFSDRARDFIESALVKRLSWLQALPIFVPEEQEDGNSEMKFAGVDFDVLDFENVYFDTKARQVMDTDFIIKRRKKLYDLIQGGGPYFNLEKVLESKPPDNIAEEQQYSYKHGEVAYYDVTGSSVTDEVELWEYHGPYNLQDEETGKFEVYEIIATIANGTILIRADFNPLPFNRKRLFFPIRPMRQANSLIGKSIPFLIKDMQSELNEIICLRADNAKLGVKAPFLVRRDSGIRYEELFWGEGNVIEFDGDHNDISVLPIKDSIQQLTFLSKDIMSDIQTVTGAVDYLMGNSSHSGETASGIRSLTEQGMFKFRMLAWNILSDIKEFITMVFAMNCRYAPEKYRIEGEEVAKFISQPPTAFEKSHYFDINMLDLGQRRDVERSQWINLLSVLLPTLGQTLGPTAAISLLKRALTAMGVEDVNEIIPENAEEQIQEQQQQQMLAQMMAGGQGSPEKVSNASPEEMAANENPKGVDNV